MRRLPSRLATLKTWEERSARGVLEQISFSESWAGSEQDLKNKWQSPEEKTSKSRGKGGEKDGAKKNLRRNSANKETMPQIKNALVKKNIDRENGGFDLTREGRERGNRVTSKPVGTRLMPVDSRAQTGKVRLKKRAINREKIDRFGGIARRTKVRGAKRG